MSKRFYLAFACVQFLFALLAIVFIRSPASSSGIDHYAIIFLILGIVNGLRDLRNYQHPSSN